jgi:hypothetical protein
MNETLVANKWYPHYKGPSRGYANPYPTPQSVLRSSVGASEYKFLSETVTTDHIRAAVIMPRGVPFEHLLNEPWSMNYHNPSWRMIIVSTVDPLRWIELARASGAIAWFKSHSQTYTYNWEPPPLDSTGNKIRPPNALGTQVFGNCKTHYKKKYDLADVIYDLNNRYLNCREIGLKHGITAATVQGIAKRAGIRLQLGPEKSRYVKT